VFAQNTITVTVPDCPTVVPTIHGLPTWVVGWGMGIGAAMLLALIVAIAVVRFQAHDTKVAVSRNNNDARVQLAQYRKTCPYCSSEYDPANKDETKTKGRGIG
jgi:hypothetical protein